MDEIFFCIRADGQELWKAGPLTKFGQRQDFSVSVQGRSQLELIVVSTKPRDPRAGEHELTMVEYNAVWDEARLDR